MTAPESDAWNTTTRDNILKTSRNNVAQMDLDDLGNVSFGLTYK